MMGYIYQDEKTSSYMPGWSKMGEWLKDMSIGCSS